MTYCDKSSSEFKRSGMCFDSFSTHVTELHRQNVCIGITILYPIKLRVTYRNLINQLWNIFFILSPYFNLMIVNIPQCIPQKSRKANRMLGLLFVSLCIGFLGLSSALLEPIPFPASLQECYEYRSYNMTPLFEAAHQIQQYCYRNFEYQQIATGKVWSGTNITLQGINYIDSLFRQIFREVEDLERQNKNGRRTKRQTINRRYRREVRSPGAYQPFSDCIVRLQNEVNLYVL